ncbi:MAG TPA: hypothetical protein PK048_02180 [Candidatus Absconditabacterales bacterium]|nr:hypothetical protein [Candidatus Absconditabacterales bacterium]
MDLIDSMGLGSNLVTHIKQTFYQLSKEPMESKRMSFLESCLEKDSILCILQGITNLPENTIKQGLTISGAGMIKIKIYESPYGSLRFHIFNTLNRKLFGNMDFDENPHVHAFQGFSHVLLGTIVERIYSVHNLSNSESILYHNFLHYVQSCSKTTQQHIIQVLHNKGYQGNYFINNNMPLLFRKHLDQLKTYYTFFDSIKKKDPQGNLVEYFFEQGVGKMILTNTRTIKQSESYNLYAENAHVIDNQNHKGATLFLTDETYQTCQFPKSKNIVLRGHGQHLPWRQPQAILRSFGDGFTDYNIGDSIKQTSLECFNNIVKTSKV